MRTHEPIDATWEFTVTDEMRAAARDVAIAYDVYANAKPDKRSASEEAFGLQLLVLLRETVSENIEEGRKFADLSNRDRTQILRFMDILIKESSADLDIKRPPSNQYTRSAPPSRRK